MTDIIVSNIKTYIKMQANKSILIFGVGELQKSIIKRAQQRGLYVIGIDPSDNAQCRNLVDAFEIVDGQDFEGTIAVAKKYHISALVTAATDKPLRMMARVANKLKLPFFSEETAQISTDKYLMKKCFQKNGIPCAKGKIIESIDDTNELSYPLIVKPRDNSGSRGVKLCYNKQDLQEALKEAFKFTCQKSILVEEFIEGKEYSIEALHYEGINQIIQFTEKKVTPFPYNVELGHIQPANLAVTDKDKLTTIINTIGRAFKFENCASHTEVKINSQGIFVIETSPRLGGDYITSLLVPLSTGINIEDCLFDIALKEKIIIPQNISHKSSGVRFFSLKGKSVNSISTQIQRVPKWNNLIHFSLKLKPNDIIPSITSSLSRYGEFIVQTDSYDTTKSLLDKYEKQISDLISTNN